MLHLNGMGLDGSLDTRLSPEMYWFMHYGIMSGKKRSVLNKWIPVPLFIP